MGAIAAIAGDCSIGTKNEHIKLFAISLQDTTSGPGRIETRFDADACGRYARRPGLDTAFPE